MENCGGKKAALRVFWGGWLGFFSVILKQFNTFLCGVDRAFRVFALVKHKFLLI